MHYLSIPLGLIAFAGLLILPGTWVTFRRPGADLPFWPRLWLGVALSPMVILAQFYALRLLGVPFHATSWALLALNLPAGYWVVRERKDAGLLAADARLAAGAVAAVCVAIFGMYFAHRTVFGHAWMHADIVYRLANGQLRPEEPVMAGLRLAYPWFGHPQHAVFSDVMASSSLANYIWPNVAYLLATLGLTWCIVRDLDGDAHATVWSLILILFAVNVVGYTLGEIAPERLLRAVPGIGGWRYSPWIRRFLSFEQEQTVIPMFSGLLYLAVNRPREAWSRYRWVIATLLLCSVGVVYTILLPAACAIVAALALVTFLSPRLPSGDVMRRLLALAAMVALSAIVTFATVRWVTQDSEGGVGVVIDRLSEMKLKAFIITMVMFPLLVGAGWVLLRRLSERRDQLLILALTGAQCIGLFIVFQISQGGGNEYKFVFPAAAALAPLAALAVSPFLVRLGKGALPVTLAGLLLMSAPAIHKWWFSERAGKRQMNVDTSQFDIRLRDSERFSGATDALRLSTPPQTVVVVRTPGIHLPTLTQRVLYAPYADEYLAGANLQGDLMLSNVKGYAPAILTGRRQILHSFFEPSAAGSRDVAFGQLQDMRRPLGFIVDDTRDVGLSAYLQSTGKAARLYEGNGLSVWLVQPRA